MLSLVYEKALIRKGYNLIAGVDEVGRGPLAGPLVAAAVILPSDQTIRGLNDSKKLSSAQREKLFVQIKAKAIAVGVGIAGHLEVDRLNVGKANQLAMERAVAKLKIKPDYILLDGGRCRINFPAPQRGITAGDAKCASIAAASIVAKVVRDRMMKKYHRLFPRYRFDRHKGYGTREHLRLLRRHGPSPIHRYSFQPVGVLA